MSRILLLYAGGTIGSEGEPLSPMSAGRFAARLTGQGLLPADVVLQALPRALDSASMQPADWLDIQAHLLGVWHAFDGFVVLHGTDTLAYTASALSYLLAGQDKPVVVTGSQLPLGAAGSDAPDNLRDAIAVARQPQLREVVVCFAGRVMRGNRSIKRSASQRDAFDSPNWLDLGHVTGGVVSLDPGALLPASGEAFDVSAPLVRLDVLRDCVATAPVWLIHLHPGFPVSLLHAALALPVPPKGWVLACYGVGNAPDTPAFLAALQAARAAKVAMIAVTQTGHGSVDLQTYQAGSALVTAGVISGGDMTAPAALTKLQLLLAGGVPLADMPALIAQPIAGECTVA